MKKECPLQTKQYEIQEARCIIPLVISKEMIKREGIRRNSWFCEFYDNEENCPMVKKIKEGSNERR